VDRFCSRRAQDKILECGDLLPFLSVGTYRAPSNRSTESRRGSRARAIDVADLLMKRLFSTGAFGMCEV
jgi:hypothetical protein